MSADLKEKIMILYQTETEAVVYKPAGIATQLSDDIKGYSLESILKNLLGKKNIYFPHRIDRITCGLIMVCFDKNTVAYYNEQIRNGNFSKYYLARVESKTQDPQKLTGTHKNFIKTEHGKSRIVRSGGAPSFLEILSVNPLPDGSGRYNVLIRLITGRTHQIRVMLAGMDIPLAGDKLYNPGSRFNEFFLESSVLEFTDPAGVKRTFSSTYKIVHKKDRKSGL